MRALNPDWTAHDLWDLAAVQQAPLHVRVRFEEERDGEGGPALLRALYYTSHCWQGEAVRIAAHLAIPPGERPMPGVLLGAGSLESAEAFARRHDVVCLAFDRPGVGDSNGPADVYENWVNLENDPRDGWMWHYVQAALRAVTYLRSLPEVSDRIGITGSSRGGTMAWIVNGLDRRISLCIAQATCGDILVALEHGGWANYIYRDDHGDVGIPRVFRDVFARYGDPIRYASSQHGLVFQILGAQDEFFPIYTVKTTAEAMPPEKHLLELIPDWDHGLFSRDDPEDDTYDNTAEADRRISACVQYAVDACLHGRRPLLRRPALTREPPTGAFAASVDESMPARAVTLLSCTDGAWLFERTPMTRTGDGYAARLDLCAEGLDKGAFYVEVEYEGGPFLSSIPQFGEAFRQRVRAMPEPPPTDVVVEDIEYHSSIDDLGPLYATVAYDRLRAGLPLCVVMHGGYAGSRERLRADVERLAHRGLFVVAPSIRGRDDSAGEPDFFGRECHDVWDVIGAVRARFGQAIAPEHVSIVGYSAGGVAALTCAVRFPDLFGVVAAFFAPGPGALRRRLEAYRRDPRAVEGEGRAKLLEAILGVMGGVPDDVPGPYAARDVLAAAGNLRHAPRVLLFHDAEDPVVPVAESEALYAEARRLGLRNVSLWRSEPGDGRRWHHGLPVDRPDLMAAEEKFAPAIAAKKWPAPELPHWGELIVPGYIKTREFAVWLGDGMSACATLRYEVGDSTARFELGHPVGEILEWRVTCRGETQRVGGDEGIVRF
ncbi:MAG: prolyl oligopeptidase family serine peptidase [Armatimonadota bacterium]